MAQPLSSGRWDATGSWDKAVKLEEGKAEYWAFHLTVPDIMEHLETMANDTNAFTLYERKALLEVTVWHLNELCN